MINNGINNIYKNYKRQVKFPWTRVQQSWTFHPKNNSSLPQWGNDKKQVYKRIIPKKTGMDYSPRIFFENSLVNMG